MSASSAGSSTSRPSRPAHVFEAIEEAGAELGLKLCGLHTLDLRRIEKAFRHFGHDITDEDHVLEAGLGFAVKTGKRDFLGRDAVLKKREAGLARRMVQFRLKDAEPLLFHNEAVVRDGKIVGTVTSGNYGHFLGGAIGMGYVPCAGESEADVLALVLRDRDRRRAVRGRGVAEADVRPEGGTSADVALVPRKGDGNHVTTAPTCALSSVDRRRAFQASSGPYRSV